MRDRFVLLPIYGFVLLFCASGARAQNAPSPVQRKAAAPSAATSRTNADETFDLNITERRITKENFTASTSVEAGQDLQQGLNIRVGVEVGATAIDVLLRNVHGRVHFRASLDRVLERLNARSATLHFDD